MRKKIAYEIKDSAALILQLLSGVLGGLFVLALVPGDGMNADVLGSLVLAVLCGLLYWGARSYRKYLHD